LALLIGTLSAIGALLFHSLFDFNVHIPANALLVAFLMGILARPVSAPLKNNPEVPAGASWARWMSAVIALVLLGISIRFLPAEFYAEKARVAFRDGHYADSLAVAQRGIAWEKKNPVLYGYLGDAEHFLTLSSPDPASARMLHEDAVLAYESGLKLFPQDTGLLLKQAQVLDLLGRFPEADAVFQKLFRYDPLFANVYAYYGLHWQLQNRFTTAERCFRVARQLGDTTIAPKALQDIERMKADPLTHSLMPLLSSPEVDLPAERVLPNP
jgi:tetratricopeptide (TPR) repeat protein